MEENAYQILGLQNGPEATDADIKKAYRKLALVKHPDKNRDNKNAAAEFAELQKAYVILTDADARKALDDLLKAKVHRAERQVVQSEKRRRMMDELEKREKQVERERSQEDVARAKLKVEIERLRRQAAEREAKLYAEQRAAAAAAAPSVVVAAVQPGPASGDAADHDPGMAEKLGRTLKVSWHKKAGDYSVAQLRAAFAGHGAVEDVVLREGKKKGSALVVMATQAAAESAAGAVCGDLDNPLLVVPFPKGAPSRDQPAGGPPARPSGGVAEGPLHSGRPPAMQQPRQPPAAAAAAGDGAGSSGMGLPAKPCAPLFAAGGAAIAAGREGLRASQSSGAPLFPGAAAPTAVGRESQNGAAIGAEGTETAGLAPGSGGQIGAGGQPSGRPLFAGAAFPSGAFRGGKSSDGNNPGGFGSYRPPDSQGVHALNRDLEQGTLQRLRQAAERQRIIQEMQKEDAK